MKLFYTIWFAQKYRMSKDGTVKIFRRAKGGTIKEAYLKACITTLGYVGVNLVLNNNKRILFTIHRAIALMFIPNPKGLPMINHKNGIKSDNRIQNLEWVTASENVRHAFSMGLMTNSLKGRCGALAMRSKTTQQVDALTNTVVGTYVSGREAAKAVGICYKKISAACTGRRLTAGGYKWQYANS